MKPQTDRGASQRTQNRVATRAGVTCRHFTSVGDMASLDGELLNYSDGGSYIVTSRGFKPGVFLVVRLVRYPDGLSSPSRPDRLRSIFLAEVKWQQKVEDNTCCRYGLGLRYLD